MKYLIKPPQGKGAPFIKEFARTWLDGYQVAD